MGLFDKKKKGRDDFDSPVERIDLSAPDPGALPETAEMEAEEPPVAAGGAAAASFGAAGSPSAKEEPPARRRPTASNYGINDAIALMRTLPSENVELVVQVVKHTLESARIDIGSIIEDASGKQQRIENRVATLREAIADLEKEIATRRTEIAELEADHKETTLVKERLVLAEKLTRAGAGSGPVTGPAEDAAPSAPAPAARSGRLSRPTGEQMLARPKPLSSPPPSPGPSSPGTLPPPSGPPRAGSHTVIPKK